MRFTQLLTIFTATLALSLTACGGSDDDGDDDPGITLDAAPTVDAPTTPDAPTGFDVTGLGEVCDTAAPACPAEAATCAFFEKAATQGFCTLSCGTGPAPAPGGQPTPPQGGDATCAGAYNGTSGTPVCAVYGTDPENQNQLIWSCGILCGEAQGMMFGDCPNGLTCTQNFCLP